MFMLKSHLFSSKPAAGSASFDKQVLMLPMLISLSLFLLIVVVVAFLAVVVNV